VQHGTTVDNRCVKVNSPTYTNGLNMKPTIHDHIHT
jgi:hypothetical protein